MSQDCNSNCGSCSQSCGDRTAPQKNFHEQLHPKSKVKKVIAVVSGKGGVGKSSVTSMLAVTSQRKGFKTAILDADITGPSIPKAFGINEKAYSTEEGLLPVKTKTGIDVMSINLLLENDTDPVVWRGPMIGGAVKQFWTDVIWEDEDYMFIDMPPGTGDVTLTVFQSLKIDGIVVVTSPQDLVSMIVTKVVKMAEMMDVPVLGLVENMSFFKCPDCGSEHRIFGESKLEKIAEEYDLKILARLPLDSSIAEACDSGNIESFTGDWFDGVLEQL